MSNLKEQLCNLLKGVVQRAGDEFSGIGLIIYDDKKYLPVTNLRNGFPTIGNDLKSDLASIASINSEFHDGFHLITKDWILTDVAQYFSPPIYKDEYLDRSKEIGGRYAAAQFGSAIEGVLMIGIATKNMGIVLFQNGKKVYSEVVL